MTFRVVSFFKVAAFQISFPEIWSVLSEGLSFKKSADDFVFLEDCLGAALIVNYECITKSLFKRLYLFTEKQVCIISLRNSEDTKYQLFNWKTSPSNAK